MRATRWLGRVILFAATAILTVIAAHFLFDTTGQAMARGISLTSSLGVTIMRVGFGAFPLASAMVTAASLLAEERIRRGLWFVVVLFGTALAVRFVSAAANGSLAASVPLIIPELVFVALSVITLALGRGDREVGAA